MVTSTWRSRLEHLPTAARFRQDVHHEPTELAQFRPAHHALVLGVPARARRVVARLISKG